jgi:hypothetical protein
MSNICFGINKTKCRNPFESYGEICVGCQCCSDDKRTRWQARLDLHQRLLEQDLHFDNWIKGIIRIQKRNRKSNIVWNNRRIARYKYLLKEVQNG